MPNNANLLKFETSPYLLQHKDNYVHWRPWGDAAFKEAKKQNKPILLSVGYAACHWCHVMAHESFEDKEIATLMNKGFINIKVDREERPDIDAIYQKALQLMGEQGGWPLTMVLTPDGEPFFGGTYFPKSSSHGRPSFSLVLEKISEAFHSKPDLVAENAAKITAHLNQLNTINSTTENRPSPDVISLADKLLEIMDPEHGGTKGAPKFPQTSLLNFLWWAYLQSGNEGYKASVILSLKRMSQGGIYDHVGGGYSRYSTDQFWFAPHFEKMLYDNAFILELLATLYQETKDVFWQRRAQQTVGWLLREMQLDAGAYAAAIDADSDGKEGAFYVWSAAEIRAALSSEKDAEFIIKTYGIKTEGNWGEGGEGVNILHLLDQELNLSDKDEARLKGLNEQLLIRRERRQRPLLDHKVLCDWNGAMIASLATAARTFKQPLWLESAKEAYAYIIENMSQKNGRLAHSLCDGKTGTNGLLDDYAYMTRAAIKLYEETGEIGYLKDALTWANHIIKHYKTTGGGLAQTPDYGEKLIVKICDAQDGATPSGNAIFHEALVRLFFLTNDDTYRQTCLELYRSFSAEVIKHPLAYTSLIQANQLLDNGLLVTIIGDPNGAEMVKMIAVLNAQPMANKIIQPINDFKNLPPNHSAHLKSKTKTPCIILCEIGRCSTPATTAKELEDLFETFPTMREKA